MCKKNMSDVGGDCDGGGYKRMKEVVDEKEAE